MSYLGQLSDFSPNELRRLADKTDKTKRKFIYIANYVDRLNVKNLLKHNEFKCIQDNLSDKYIVIYLDLKEYQTASSELDCFFKLTRYRI